MVINLESFLTKAFLLFLPFSYALTIRIGFPLKPSEIALFLLIIYYLFKGSIKVKLFKSLSFQILAIFVLIIFVSIFINFFWVYGYPMKQFVSRFGYTFDSITKYIYVLFAFFVFVISSNAFFGSREKSLHYLFLGATIASFYSWYLIASGGLKIPPILLPGMDQPPQRIILSVGEFIRCGTFKEGNIMGLFLLSMASISFQFGRKKLGYFYLFTIITTFSSIAIVLAVLFIILLNSNLILAKKRLIPMIISLLVIGIILSVLYKNENFKRLIISKFNNNSNEITNVGSYSRLDRINSAYTGLIIFNNNPVWGVGLSNYALHYDHYLYDSRFPASNVKPIPNNIYIETMAETGVLGIISLVMFLISLYRSAGKGYSSLRIGLLIILLYFIAFPTFTVLFLWVFFGLIASVKKVPVR